ncbi:MAG: phosphoribosylformylglycinamidine synthase subunit PurS [Planctomycetes bacterium]|nr:phosphoribosylformylglycinamidine synthase subunit PurS [Planctomycetota bacterium]
MTAMIGAIGVAQSCQSVLAACESLLMSVYRVEILPKSQAASRAQNDSLAADLRAARLADLRDVQHTRLFFLEGALTRSGALHIATALLVDPIVEWADVLAEGDEPPCPTGRVALEVHPRPGVMDPVAESTLAALRAAGFGVDSVRTARRYLLSGDLDGQDVRAAADRVLANDCIEQVVLGTTGVQPAPRPPVFEFALRHVALRNLDDEALERLARDGHLFLALDEMRAIQAHFRTLEREPTDLELETLAQTWSEHCVHKTLTSAVVYRGAPLPSNGGRAASSDDKPDRVTVLRYENLLKDTIVRATEELMAARRGPTCLSVFQDNAGVIAFDDRFGIAFKVETHNHPSAIEPYGGAATGVGGCIRDVIGCGLGARPIANTDVFCFAPPDWPADRLPKGVLHPRRVMRGVVSGVADYGNRMGIPTVNGAITFDPRYLGNPLVYCGCVGLIPRDKVHKAAQPGDLVVLIGGRTGRDGIHGATFSSAELTDSHADEFSHAVQIGNAITEKRFLDALLQARDDESGCLYSALTDCGAGGLSSAVGEMGETVGAVIELERVPLKYAGLRYDEIWISEAQERMVLAVPPDKIDRFMQIMEAEEVETTVIGVFGPDPQQPRDRDAQDGPRLVVRYAGHTVGQLDMRFLHDGLPKRERVAEWWPAGPQADDQPHASPAQSADSSLLARLKSTLRCPNIASKEWVTRQYDHEVQGGSVIKPLCGPGLGPADAAVLRPRLDTPRGIALGCGLAPHLSDVDPYWMAAAAVDEALRNVVCVGGDPGQTAILDNFCWGSSTDPRQLGALVRACQACYDAAVVYGVPFISGKDSLNNEFALEAEDVDTVLQTVRDWAARADGEPGVPALTAAVMERIRSARRLSIPGTVLISAVSIVPDTRACVTPDLKSPGSRLFLVGGWPATDFRLSDAAKALRAVAAALAKGLVTACHDSSDGGWLTAVAEMAIAAERGADIELVPGVTCDPFADYCGAFVVETTTPDALRECMRAGGVPLMPLGRVRDDCQFVCAEESVAVSDLRAAWTNGAAQ